MAEGAPSQVLMAVTATGAVLLIGWLDLVTGPDISLSLFYLVPVVACGWWSGWSLAIATALLASACWLGAELYWQDDKDLIVSLWNGVTRIGIFLSLGWGTARLRAGRDRLAVLTEQAQALAAREAAAARTDPLTGLANRRAFRESLEIELQRSRRDRSPICLACLDLDDFKKVNDVHGHAAGDRLLLEVADALRASLRRTDLPARLGGDEFALLLWHVQPEDAEATAQRIVREVSRLAEGYPGTRPGASLGVIALEGPVLAEAEEVLHLADLVMLEAKRGGKGRVVLREVAAESWSSPAIQ